MRTFLSKSINYIVGGTIISALILPSADTVINWRYIPFAIMVFIVAVYFILFLIYLPLRDDKTDTKTN